MKTNILTQTANGNCNEQKSLSQQTHPILYKSIILAVSLILGVSGLLQAQQDERQQPTWLLGFSAAANFNFFGGSMQKLSPGFTAPDPFTKGFGIGGYGSGMIEYRHNNMWGITFNVAFDNRYGILHYSNGATIPGDLTARLSSMTLEPSFRIAPWQSPLYFFVGPTLNFNVQKSFAFRQPGNNEITRNGNLGYVNDPILSGQAGVGYEIQLSSPNNPRYTELSPFIAYAPFYSPNQLRSIEKLTLNTLRVGIAFKFGCIEIPKPVEAVEEPVEPEVIFSVQVPTCIPMQQLIKETLPLRNYVFFDKGSSQIPDRYIKLTQDQAATFREELMQNSQSPDPTARSSRQLAIYYNLINIVGVRMRDNPSTAITLVGSSGGEGADKGKALAIVVKDYLVRVFGIDGSRIQIEGRDRPIISSKQLHTTQQFDLVNAEDRRVDIMSNSPQIEMPYGDSTGMLKPAQISYEDPNSPDAYVAFSAIGAKEALTLWMISITDDKGNTQYYGTYTDENQLISARKILGNNATGAYTVYLTGLTKSGKVLVKESAMNLVCKSESKTPNLRYSILFEFDKSKTSGTYSNFLTNVVAVAIKDNSTVVVHGHTDIVGDKGYNLDLSKGRSNEALSILQNSLKNSGNPNVAFQTYWFGADPVKEPFANAYPEERFYNRTVIIDIIQ